MSADNYRSIVARLKSWGFDISETSGCYSRSNGLGWSRGNPIGHVNHHYVCSLNPSQAYINSLVNGLMDGRTVNWFADVNGRGYLIGVGPMNHAGTGNSSVLARSLADQPPLGPATAAGDMTGNTFYSGTECQHPGDSTPWPQPMVDVMIAISAAEAVEFGWSENRIIEHFEWTGRKIDMSLWGGRTSGAAGIRMRGAVANRMEGKGLGTGPDKPTDWFDMATQQDLTNAINAAIPAIAVAVWTQMVSDRTGAQLLNAAAINAESAAKGIGDIPTNVWIKGITDETANVLLARAAGPKPTPPATSTTYTVKAGDTFNAIATAHGITPDALAAANPQVTNRSDIAVGQVLTIPKA